MIYTSNYVFLLVQNTHTRVKSSNSLEYNLHIIKERDKRKQNPKSQKTERLTDSERILQILNAQNKNTSPPAPPVLPS